MIIHWNRLKLINLSTLLLLLLGSARLGKMEIARLNFLGLLLSLKKEQFPMIDQCAIDVPLITVFSPKEEMGSWSIDQNCCCYFGNTCFWRKVEIIKSHLLCCLSSLMQQCFLTIGQDVIDNHLIMLFSLENWKGSWSIDQDCCGYFGKHKFWKDCMAAFALLVVELEEATFPHNWSRLDRELLDRQLLDNIIIPRRRHRRSINWLMLCCYFCYASFGKAESTWSQFLFGCLVEEATFLHNWSRHNRQPLNNVILPRRRDGKLINWFMLLLLFQKHKFWKNRDCKVIFIFLVQFKQEMFLHDWSRHDRQLLDTCFY